MSIPLVLQARAHAHDYLDSCAAARTLAGLLAVASPGQVKILTPSLEIAHEGARVALRELLGDYRALVDLGHRDEAMAIVDEMIDRIEDGAGDGIAGEMAPSPGTFPIEGAH